MTVADPLQRRVRSRDTDLATGIPRNHLEKVKSWGGASAGTSYVYRPSTIDGLRTVLRLAHESGLSVGLRGSGNSYGDATQNDEQIVLDSSRLNRILDWDPRKGRIRVEPGVTIDQLWRYVLGDGWWPAVVPGTSKPTIGGCAGMNVHGKNAWKAGTIGDHIYEFDLLTSTGETLTCSRSQNSDLFHAAVGGFGAFGVFTSLTLGMQRVFSGCLEVEALASRNLAEMLYQFEQLQSNSDYLVGWTDALASGRATGRGQIHRARYLAAGQDAAPERTLQWDYQLIGDTFLGVMPRSAVWRFMRPLMHNPGVRLTNTAKYWTSRLGHGKKYRQTHVAFHFLLDYVPGWKRAYGPGGLIQYQCFIPAEAAPQAFSDLLKVSQRRGLPSYLAVLKRHRRDDFLISHGVDGYSLALDFKVTPSKRARLLKLAAEFDAIVLGSGGRFYLAKDSTLRPEVARRYLGEDTLSRLHQLKNQHDPQHLFQTNLWRRIFLANR